MRRFADNKAALHLQRRDAKVTPKERTERAEALKTAFEAYVGDGMFSTPEQHSRARETLCGEKLMGRFPEGVAERTEEVIPRDACRAGGISDAHGFIHA